MRCGEDGREEGGRWGHDGDRGGGARLRLRRIAVGGRGEDDEERMAR